MVKKVNFVIWLDTPKKKITPIKWQRWAKKNCTKTVVVVVAFFFSAITIIIFQLGGGFNHLFAIFCLLEVGNYSIQVNQAQSNRWKWLMQTQWYWCVNAMCVRGHVLVMACTQALPLCFETGIVYRVKEKKDDDGDVAVISSSVVQWALYKCFVWRKIGNHNHKKYVDFVNFNRFQICFFLPTISVILVLFPFEFQISAKSFVLYRFIADSLCFCLRIRFDTVEFHWTDNCDIESIRW